MVRNIIDVKALKCKNDLMKNVMHDRSMSVDEERLVNTTISNLQELRHYVRTVLSDNIITATEKENLSFFVEKIAIDALELAREDKAITYDERVLLQIIKKLVLDLRKVIEDIKIGIEDHSIDL
ncbi:MAG: hypothetical protein ACXAD7_22550 [Candidatus Kariarchaeaceae archaeon]